MDPTTWALLERVALFLATHGHPDQAAEVRQHLLTHPVSSPAEPVHEVHAGDAGHGVDK